MFVTEKDDGESERFENPGVRGLCYDRLLARVSFVLPFNKSLGDAS